MAKTKGKRRGQGRKKGKGGEGSMNEERDKGQEAFFPSCSIWPSLPSGGGGSRWNDGQ
jgi:hypothetical protein